MEGGRGTLSKVHQNAKKLLLRLKNQTMIFSILVLMRDNLHSNQMVLLILYHVFYRFWLGTWGKLRFTFKSGKEVIGKNIMVIAVPQHHLGLKRNSLRLKGVWFPPPSLAASTVLVHYSLSASSFPQHKFF